MAYDDDTYVLFIVIKFLCILVPTRISRDADKPARRISRSVNVTKHSTIAYATYNFVLCNSNFVFKTRCFYVDVDVDVEEIRAQTNNCLYARS